MKTIQFLSTTLLLSLLFVNCKDSKTGAHQNGVLSRGEQTEEHLDRFEQEIQAFEQADKKEMPPKGAVLFVGSSSIRLWSTLESDFAPVPVINRGFGGATTPEVDYYADRIIYKYKPELIVFYCGENDIAEETAPAVAFQNLKKYIGETEKNLAGTPVIFISAKPSVARWELWRKFQQFNSMVEQFATARPDFHYVDISSTLLNEEGKPDSTLFVEDGLHLNEMGYEKWVEKLKPMVEEFYGGRTAQ